MASLSKVKTLFSKLKISEPWRHGPLHHQPLHPAVTNTTIGHHLILSHPVRLLLDDRSPPSSLPPSTYSQPPSASHRHPSQMAVLNLGCGSDDKENAPPPSAARGIAVKRQTMKRPGGGGKAPRRRPPLRDITGLFVTVPCPPPSTAVLPALSVAALQEAGPPGAGASGGVTVKPQGSHSPRMGFR